MAPVIFLAADSPTWENLIPWIIGFCFTMVSGVLIAIIKDFRGDLREVKVSLDQVKANQDSNAEKYVKKIEEEAGAIIRGQEGINQRQDKMANALFLSHRRELIQMAVDPAIHPQLQQQCKIMVEEIDEATKANKPT